MLFVLLGVGNMKIIIKTGLFCKAEMVNGISTAHWAMLHYTKREQEIKRFIEICKDKNSGCIFCSQCLETIGMILSILNEQEMLRDTVYLIYKTEFGEPATFKGELAYKIVCGRGLDLR